MLCRRKVRRSFGICSNTLGRVPNMYARLYRRGSVRTTTDTAP